MSWAAQPMVAATKAGAAPTVAITTCAVWDWASNGLMRHIRYTPAVTMVAAWIRAETGVGPSMASASQGNRGIWADLPTRARNSNRQMAVAVPDVRAPAWAKTPR